MQDIHVFDRIEIVQTVPESRSTGPVTAQRGRGGPSGPASGAGVPCRIRGIVAMTVAAKRRALLALGVLAAVLCPATAPAADRIDEVVSLVAQERYAEARKMLEPLLKGVPIGPRARLIHGILRVREGHPEKAIAIFESIGADHPELFEPYNNLAVLYADQGRLEDARGALIAALERKPDAVAYANLGDIYTRLARRAYERAREVRTNPGQAPQPASSVTPVPTAAAAIPRRSEPKAAAAAIPQRFQSKPVAAVMPVSLEPKPAAPSPAQGGGKRAAATPASSAALSGECVRAGGFGDRTGATEAAQWMQSRGAEVIDIAHQSRRLGTSQWVHLPPSPSRAAAAAKMAELKGMGVRDIAVMRKGSHGFVVSLGVFGEESNMRRRIARMKELGYSATFSPRGKRVSEYVVRASAGTARAVFDGAWTSQFPGNPIRFIDCPVVN